MTRAHTHLAVVQFDQRGGGDYCSYRALEGWGYDAFLRAWKISISRDPIDRILIPADTIAHLHIYAAPDWCRQQPPEDEPSVIELFTRGDQRTQFCPVEDSDGLMCWGVLGHDGKHDYGRPGPRTQITDELQDAITNLHNMLRDAAGLTGAGQMIRNRYPGLSHQIDLVTRQVVHGGTF